MKKYLFLVALSTLITIAGCDDKKIDITDTNLDIESCDKYFEVMECVLENDNDEDYSEEKRDELRQTIKDKQTEWESLDPEILGEICDEELEKLEMIKERLYNI